jgi:pimeloyl-ACP methyl ester carboxylesterase
VIDAPDIHGVLLRVTYRSQSVAGSDIAVSGLIAYPRSDAPSGGRPVLSWAHGTTGMADVCAPSAAPNQLGPIAVALNILLDKGFVVVATDYEGLGTPGLHPYLVGASEGRGVLDVARAALQIPDAHASDRIVIWGHSQGGQAALFAQEIAPTWAPELQVLGTAAGAPATELPLLVQQLAGSRNAFYEVMVAAGFQAAYPELDLRAVLSDAAIARIGILDSACSGAVATAYADLGSQVQRTDPMSVPAWAARINENNPGTVRTGSPIFLYQGGADELIPPATTAQLFTRLCGLGQTIERKVYDGQSHTGVLLPAFADILQWIDARIAGTPATSGCP